MLKGWKRKADQDDEEKDKPEFSTPNRNDITVSFN